MLQYVLNIIQPDGPPPPMAALAQVMQDVDAVMKDLKAADAWVFNGGLQPASSSTVVRWKDGAAVVTDGPFAEAREHIGGFVIVKCGDLDDALRWAGRFARAIGLPIEVRPFQARRG